MRGGQGVDAEQPLGALSFLRDDERVAEQSIGYGAPDDIHEIQYVVDVDAGSDDAFLLGHPHQVYPRLDLVEHPHQSAVMRLGMNGRQSRAVENRTILADASGVGDTRHPGR